ncbi:DUF4345 family protein [Protaetiibacter mangrovi]|uniref:DUF4345 domain-containing protein n=1 Tax=Protaetiibacter mangrovi TaxID=2970926 RepID=A0ABT1ZEZ5_9MICO|nr:DUF4345 family protein [Protaetiibacter mangrovi]MCS0499268.1 hypothetical protein [Protaetiibacter mangrovi]TPX04526.1 DUF4345 domain-containing protein [Schumannella luteola]
MIATTRVLLGLLAIDALVVGLWNQLRPESFYADFPTVALDPPFSEHYARDFGGATLGIAVVLIAAIIAPTGALVTVAGVAFSVFAVPHAVFHATHLERADAGETAYLLLGNGLVAAIGVIVIVLGVLRMGRDRGRLHDPALDRPARGRDRQRAGGGVRGPVP